MLCKLCSNLWIKVKIFSYRINQTYVNFLAKLFIPNWSFLVAQMVKNPPAVWKTWVQSLNREESPGEGHGNSLQYSCLENPHGQTSLVGYSPWDCKESHDWATKQKIKKKSTQLDNISTWYKIKITKGNVMLIITGV